MLYQYIFILLICINFVHSITSNQNNLRLRNLGLRIIVFKKKKLNKLLVNFHKIGENYYNKSLVLTANGVNYYNELSEDDKMLLDAVLSLCY